MLPVITPQFKLGLRVYVKSGKPAIMLQQICSYFKAVAFRKRDNMVILSPPIIFIIANFSIFVTFLCSWNMYGTEKQDHQFIKFIYIRHSEFSGLVHLYFSLERPTMVLSIESQCETWVDFGFCLLNRLWNPLQVSTLTNGNNYGIIYTKLHWYRCWFRFQSDVVMISITRYLTNWMVNGGCRRVLTTVQEHRQLMRMVRDNRVMMAPRRHVARGDESPIWEKVASLEHCKEAPRCWL